MTVVLCRPLLDGTKQHMGPTLPTQIRSYSKKRDFIWQPPTTTTPEWQNCMPLGRRIIFVVLGGISYFVSMVDLRYLQSFPIIFHYSHHIFRRRFYMSFDISIFFSKPRRPQTHPTPLPPRTPTLHFSTSSAAEVFRRRGRGWLTRGFLSRLHRGGRQAAVTGGWAGEKTGWLKTLVVLLGHLEMLGVLDLFEVVFTCFAGIL